MMQSSSSSDEDVMALDGSIANCKGAQMDGGNSLKYNRGVVHYYTLYFDKLRTDVVVYGY